MNNNDDSENTNVQRQFLGTKEGKMKSKGKPSTSGTEEGYCNEATAIGPSADSERHQAKIYRQVLR